MIKHLTIESWASSLGYIVEEQNGLYIWFKENDLVHKSCSSKEELIESILQEIKNSYIG